MQIILLNWPYGIDTVCYRGFQNTTAGDKADYKDQS